MLCAVAGLYKLLQPSDTSVMKKSILIIVENVPVPFDTRVWMEAKSLQANGYEVTVLSPRGKGAEQRHEVLEGIHIFRHPTPRGR